jgi:nucleotide-binding universal stress UspA family protein
MLMASTGLFGPGRSFFVSDRALAGCVIGAIEKEGRMDSALIEHARRREFDLLVVGRKGHSALERFLLGSVTQKLAAHAPCPLLIVPKRAQ